MEKTIQSLLYRYDCVIVPDFGGFVAMKKSAIFHPMDYRFEPPKKIVGFNSDLIHNDGLLANEIAKKQDISYQEATQEIKDTVTLWKNKLENDHLIEIPALGTFEKTDNGFEFSPSENQNFDLQTFGLSTVKGKYILRDRKQEKVEKTTTAWTSYAASIAFAIMVGASGFFANQELVQPQLSSVFPLLNTHTTIVKPEVKPIAPVIELDNIQEDVAIIPTVDEVLALNEMSSVKDNTTSPKIATTETPQDKAIKENTLDLSVKTYQVIGGSFKVYSRAMEHQAKLKRQGHERAVIVGKVGNFFMVAFDTFHNEQEAIAYKKEIQKMGYDVFMRP